MKIINSIEIAIKRRKFKTGTYINNDGNNVGRECLESLILSILNHNSSPKP